MTLKEENRLLRAALRSVCRCAEPDVSPPTDWGTRARIPHHCDCPWYVLELPDARTAPSAHADALAKRAVLLDEKPVPSPTGCLPGECRCEMRGMGCPHRQL